MAGIVLAAWILLVGAVGSGPLHAAEEAVSPEIARLIQSAEAGSAEAAAALGRAYAEGRGIAVDLEQAEKWLRLAVDGKAADARRPLATLLLQTSRQGDEAERVAEGVRLLREAAPSDPASHLVLGRLHAEGRLVPEDADSAERHFRAAAEAGEAEASFLLGELLEQASGASADPDAALAAYRAAAERDHAPAKNRLGLLHWHGGLGIRPDAAAARKWFEQAVAQNFVPARFNLALLLDASAPSGEERPASDAGQAVLQILAAASAGLPEAQDRLGSWYRDGRHVARDFVAAAAWFRNASNAGHIPAKINLAQLLESDPEQAGAVQTAMALYRDASAAGHPVAHARLAVLLGSGVGGVSDPVRARAHAAVAAEAGFAPAASTLASLDAMLSDEQRQAAGEIQATLRSDRWGE